MTKREALEIIDLYKYSLSLRQRLSRILLPPIRQKDYPVKVKKAFKKLGMV